MPTDRPTAPLRFGIMCNGATLAAFQLAAVRRLIETGAGEPAVLIVDDRRAPAQPRRAQLARRLTAPKLLWRLYRELEQPALARQVPLPPELANLPRVACRPQTAGRFSERFSAEEIAQIRSYDLDFMLRFAFGIIRGEILDAARYGVWSFHHGDERRYRGGPPAFWEIYEGSLLTGAILQRLTDRLDAGIVLRRGLLKTIDYSYKHNLNLLLNETVHWPASMAREIQSGVPQSALESTTDARVYTAPTNAQMLRYLGRLSFNVARRLVARQLREEWNVGALRLTPAQVLQGAVARDVKWCPRPPGGWYADPSARRNGHGIDVLCERMRVEADRAYIASLYFTGDAWRDEQPVIEPDCHASYPYLFTVDGETYCVPETQQAGEVALYRARRFPHDWERVTALLTGLNVVDSTIFQHDDRWWLLCTDAEGSGHRLLAFYADRITGPWHPHPANPVKTDPRGSRPAGAPFWHEGALYRPAQDCSKTYGGRITINKIVALSPERFEEEAVAHLNPDPRERYGKALHTLAFAGDWAIIDGKRWRWKRSRT